MIGFHNFSTREDYKNLTADLYGAYRVTEEEFQQIREIEKKLVWRQFDIPYDDRVMIFTLHATELWRREYAGGPWTWDILMPHFGMPEDLQDYARQLVGHGARN